MGWFRGMGKRVPYSTSRSERFWKTSASAAALSLGLMGPAYAGDLGNTGVKDPIPDDLNWHGVTIYGTVDVGYAYQTHGAPLGGAFYPGLEYNLNGSKNANSAISSLAENGLEQSKIGVKVEEAVGYGWLAIGKLETAFNPLSGELADACASMVQNNGRLYQDQSAN